MKALVTGASGFIGSRLIEVLVQKGFSVRMLVRSTSKVDHLKGMSLEQHFGDLRDPQSLKGCAVGVDYVFHLGGAIWSNEAQGFLNHNTDGTNHLCDTVVSESPQLKRFVFVSSVAATGPSPSQTPLRESDKDPGPVSDYGLSKLHAETGVKQRLGSIPVSIMRPPPVYGPRDKAILQFLQVVNRGICPNLGKKHFSFIFVDDLVEMLVRAAVEPTQGPFEVYYTVHKEVLSWRQVMTEMCNALNRPNAIKLPAPAWILRLVAEAGSILNKVGFRVELDRDKYRQMRPNNYVYSHEKVLKNLKYESQTSFHEGLQKTVQWYRDQGWL